MWRQGGAIHLLAASRGSQLKERRNARKTEMGEGGGNDLDERATQKFSFSNGKATHEDDSFFFLLVFEKYFDENKGEKTGDSSLKYVHILIY